jgi:mannose-6-phosphate isomerase-like protein (cupin superfamily)
MDVVCRFMHVSAYDDIEPFVTLDGSEIREWAGRVSAPAMKQSLAEATVPAGAVTIEHYHVTSEELYLVTAGEGRLTVDGEERVLRSGDCALIPPGARHKVANIGDEPLRIVCSCSPPYSDEDTRLVA